MFLKSFFAPELPAGYRPGALLARIAERDLPEMECIEAKDAPAAAIPLKGQSIDVRERIKKDFLLHTTLAVFGLGDAEGPACATAHHTGGLKRTGVSFTGDQILTDPLSRPEVTDALLPLDFTRLEIFGTPAAFRIEIETYGGSEVVMRVPRTRRYVPLGPRQSHHLLLAFDAIAGALSKATGDDTEGGAA